MSKSEFKPLERRVQRLENFGNYHVERHPAVVEFYESLSEEEVRISLRTDDENWGLYDRLPKSAFDWARTFAPIAEKRFGHLTYDQWPNWALEACVLKMRLENK